MELMIPSLAALLAGIAIVMIVLPGFAVTALITGSVIMVALASYIHWHKFGVMEYERATWMDNLRKYASYVIILLILVGAYGFYALNASASTSMSTPALPPMAVPTVGGGVQAMIKTVSSRINELVRRGRLSSD